MALPNKRMERAVSRPPLMRIVTLLEDRRQKGLFPTTIGGGATVKSSDKWRVTSDEQGAAKANL